MTKENFNIFTLGNGLRVIFQQSDRIIGHCGLVINVGSRDEQENEHGMAHFIEHCIFKGTKKRKAFHILNRLDSVGADLNAFTTKEDTWIHCSFLKEHLERSMELISDITFNSTFPPSELKKEKEVIIDEINSYLDSPSDTIFDTFEEKLFDNHPLGRGILGTTKSVRSFNQKKALNFIQSNYDCKEMVLSIIGPYTIKSVEKLAAKHFGQVQLKPMLKNRQVWDSHNRFEIEENKNLHQTHIILGNTGYSYKEDQKMALSLLTNYLGGPSMNSKLSMSLREKHGLGYNIEANYAPYSDTGVFQIYLGTEYDAIEKSLKLIHKEFDLLKNQPLGIRQLHNIKRQIEGQLAIGQDNEINQMFSIGRSLLLYNEVDTTQELLAKLHNITAKEITSVANYIFDKNKLSTLIYH